METPGRTAFRHSALPFRVAPGFWLVRSSPRFWLAAGLSSVACGCIGAQRTMGHLAREDRLGRNLRLLLDRKSTRLNSSHQIISYAVFCLKKKNQKKTIRYNSI